MVFAGATSARASALQAGAVDAAILLPPFNFHATAAGFNDLGLTIDYAPELPFSGTVVNRNWAAKNQAILQRLLAAHSKSVAWFYDAKNRAEAIDDDGRGRAASRPRTSRSPTTSSSRASSSSRTGTISRTKLNALIAALQQLGDLPARLRHRTVRAAGRDQAERLRACRRGTAMRQHRCLRVRLAGSRWQRSRRAAGASAQETVTARLGRLVLGQRLAELRRDREGLLRRRRHQARSGVRAVQRRGDPAARGRLDQRLDQLRPGRSDPRHREGRAARASCASRCRSPPYALLGQARDQEHQGPQGQDALGRRRQGHHPHLRRADAGGERRQARRVRHDVCRRDLGALFGAAGRRGRCRDPDAAVQFPRRSRRASPISATPSNTSTCRSPASP